MAAALWLAQPPTAHASAAPVLDLDDVDGSRALAALGVTAVVGWTWGLGVMEAICAARDRPIPPQLAVGGMSGGVAVVALAGMGAFEFRDSSMTREMAVSGGVIALGSAIALTAALHDRTHTTGADISLGVAGPGVALTGRF